MKKIILAFTLLSFGLFASDGEKLANKLSLKAEMKVKRQWNRIFSKEKYLKRYGIDKLSTKEQKELKNYLLKNAADAISSEVAGD